MTSGIPRKGRHRGWFKIGHKPWNFNSNKEYPERQHKKTWMRKRRAWLKKIKKEIPNDWGEKY